MAPGVPPGAAVGLALGNAVGSPELGRQDTAGYTAVVPRAQVALEIPGEAVPGVAQVALRFSRSGVKDSRLDRRCVAGVCRAG